MNFYVTTKYGQTSSRMPLGYHWMIPASSWFDNKRGTFRKPNLPLHIDNFAIDCGGFVAARIWGNYRYTANQYIAWIYQFLLPPEWAAIMDYCCEDEITSGKHGIVRERQQATTWKIEKFWRDYRHERWVWIPTVQGWNITDYIRHATEIKPLIDRWKSFYGKRGQSHLFRVGIGTLCARPHTADIQAIVCAVADILPGIKFHLWGVKLQVLRSTTALPRIESVDSAAWAPGGLGRNGHEAREEYESLCITQRAHEFKVALPRYMAKVNAAMQQPKQLTLWAS